MTYARPDLVRRRGLPLDRVMWSDRTDPRLPALAHPEHCAAIGTFPEYDRLLRAPSTT